MPGDLAQRVDNLAERLFGECPQRRGPHISALAQHQREARRHRIVRSIVDHDQVIGAHRHVYRAELSAHLFQRLLRGIDALGAVADGAHPLVGPIGEHDIGWHGHFLLTRLKLTTDLGRKQAMIVPEGARNIEFLGHTDQGGRGDGVQVMVARGHAYVGTRVRRGVMVTDVRDPRNPKPVNFLAMHPNSVSMHLQAADDLLLCIQEADQRALLTQQEYYGGSGKVESSRFGKRGEDYAAGMRVYDLKDPANPRHIGSMEVEGLGLHRIWYVGGRYAYASALLDGYTDHILMIIDMADPTKPREIGRWWIPGQHAAGGEEPSWKNRVALHHAIVFDDYAYGSWRDGGLTILDVKDKSAPKLLAHRNWCPPYGGGTHNAVPLHDRNLLVVAD